jgi:hypothetical protein
VLRTRTRTERPGSRKNASSGVRQGPSRAGAQTRWLTRRTKWIESFEGRLQILRPHLTGRVLGTMSNAAWHSRGARGEDPIKAANAASADLDARAKKGKGG